MRRQQQGEGGKKGGGMELLLRVVLQAEREVELPCTGCVHGEVAVVVGEGDTDLNHAQYVYVHLQALVPAVRGSWRWTMQRVVAM